MMSNTPEQQEIANVIVNLLAYNEPSTIISMPEFSYLLEKYKKEDES